MNILFTLFLSALLSIPSTPLPIPQEAMPERDRQLREFADRYGVWNWPGKYGSVIAGVETGYLTGDDFSLVADGDRWLEVDGEWVQTRRFASKDGRITLEVAVTRTCRTAHQLLFEHLSCPKSMVPLDPPALPYGRIRLDDLGDVCFALPQHGKGDFHSIEFARNNVVVRILGKERGTNGLTDLAEAIDRHLRGRPLYREWGDSNRWPSIDKFAGSSSPVKSGSIIPLLVSVTDPGNDVYTVSWEVSAGGILEEGGRTYFYAEGTGTQALTLLVVNQSGLASSARIELQVTE